MKPTLDKNTATAMRQVAEARLKPKPVPRRPLNEVELQRLQHELEVHQIELEMQNEELRAIRAELETNVERYTDLFDFAPVGYFTLTADGKINQVNLTGTKLIGVERAQLLGRRLQSLFDEQDRTVFGGVLRQLFASGSRQSCEVRLLESAGRQRAVGLEATLSPGGGECRLVMLDLTARKQDESELAESRNYAQTLLAASPVAIITYKVSGETVSANEAAARLVGTTLENLKQQNFRELASWKQSEFLAKAELALASGQQQTFENHFVSTFGAEVWAACQFVPFEFAAKPHLLLLARDITDRKAMEAALQEREAQLRLYAEHSPAAIAMFDRDMKYLVASHRWLTDFHLGGQAIIGRSHYEVFPELPPRWLEIHRRCLAGATEKCDEDAYLRADGTTEHVRWEIQPWLQADGAIGGIIIFFEHITARKQAEAAMRESQARYRALFDRSLDCVFLHDFAGRFLDANQASLDLLGYQREDIPTLTFASLLTEDQLPLAFQTVAEITTTGHQQAPTELRLRGKDGRQVQVNIRSSLINREGKPFAIQGIARDITERKRMEDELKRTTSWLLNTQRISKVGGWAFNVKTGVVWVSPEARLIYGVSGSEPVTIAFIQSFPLPQYRPLLDRALHELIENQQAYDLEFKIQRANDGAIVDIHSVAEYDAGKGEVLGVIEDITERNRAAAQTRAFAQLSLRLSVATNPQGAAAEVTESALLLFDWDASFLCLYDSASDTVRRLISQDTISGQRQTVPSDPGTLQPSGMLRRVLQQGGQLVLRRDAADDEGITQCFGDTNQAALSLMYVPLRHQGQVTGFLSVQSHRRNAYTPESLTLLQALADQCAGAIKRIESDAALRVAQAEAEHFRAAMDEVQACVFMKDTQSRYLYANRPTLQLLGCSGGALVGSQDAQYFPPDTLDRLREIDARVLQGEQTVEEINMPDARGGRRVYWEVKTPIYADAGHRTVCGLLGIATDVTERKLMEETLEHSRHLLAESEKMGKLGTWEVDMATGQVAWTETVYAIHEQDPACPPTLEQALNFYTPACRPIIERAVRRAMEEGEPYDLELQIITAKGGRRDVHTIGHADLAHHKVFGFLQDITLQKQAEQALRESEGKLSKMFQSSPVAMSLSTLREGRLLEINGEYLRLLERTRDEVIGHTAYEFGLWPDPAQRTRVGDECGQQSSVRNVELDLRAKSGRIHHIVWSGEELVIHGERCVLATMLDITERKQAESALRRSERALKTISACGQALVHAATEAELLEQICHTIAELGGFRMTWVGFAENDVANTVRVAAVAGHEAGYLAEAKISWSEAEEWGRGPAGIAFRTGQTIICQDLQTDLDFAPWRVEAGRRGYASSISLPLRQAERTFGILMIYAAETNAFHPTEVALLTAMSEDLAYGLQALRTRLRHQQAEAALIAGEARFRAIFHINAVATAIVEPDSTISLVNDVYCQVTGYTRPEVIGQSWKQTVASEDVERLSEYNRRRVLNLQDAPAHYEFRFRHKNGQVRHCQIAVALIPGSGQIIASMLDITERKQAKQQLRASEERYRRLFELESDALVLVDVNTHRFVDVNQSAQRLYGFSREEFLQMKAEDISSEPEKTRTTVGSGNIFVPLRWHRKKNGAIFPVEINTSRIEHLERQTELTAIRNITERQQALNRLQETTAQLLDAQRIASLGSYVFEAETGQWTCSAVLDDLFGLPEAGFIKDITGWLDLVHPEERAEMRQYMQEQVLRNQAAFDRHYRIVRPNDRQERWVHGLGKLVLDDHGRVVKMVGVIQDITERKQAEQQLKVQASALAAAANAIVITNREGKIEWVNPAFTKLSGYSAEEAIGCNPRVLKSGQHPRAYYTTLWTTILTGNVWHGEIINKRKDGSLFTEEMTITPVWGADAQITHFIAVKQDVTERRQLENRIQQAQKMEAIGTLAGGIAHDFNNMLGAMFGYAHLLQQDTEGNPLAQESVAEILKAANRAKDLVQQILTFSRQRGQKPQVIKLDTIVKEVVKFLRASMPAHIKIEMNLSTEAPAVFADPTQIYQVTMNLATNAFHAMEDAPGLLAVGLDAFQPDAKLMQVHRQLKPIPYARLTVADTGHGMDAKTLERIFEPFFTTKPVGKGTGLGLAVVHGIMESHNGVITVESQVGRGTTFSLYFPAQAQAEASTTTDNSTVPQGHGQKILVVDDEPALTAVLQKTLQRLGYHVAASNSAGGAIRRFRENPAWFDLVITDLTMPEINGLEVASQIRAIRPDLPIILVSGYSTDVDAERLRAAGICERLDKPVSPSAIAEAVARVLKKL